MKQIIVAILSCVLVLAFMACNNENSKDNNETGSNEALQHENENVGGASSDDLPDTETLTNADKTDEAVISDKAEQNAQAESDGICGYPTADKWGVYLRAKDVTPKGLTLVCTQSGGNAEGELQTGSYYRIEQYESKSDEWIEADCFAEVSWTMEALMIPAGQSVEWKVDWEFLYGKLKPGYYRIVKEIMDFKGTGNHEESEYFATFEISKSDTVTRCAEDLK